MRKIQITIAAFVVALTVSAIASGSALALNKFLLNGNAITEEIDVTLTGEFLLEDMGAFGTPDVLCSLFWDGTIKPPGKTGFVSEVLMLNGENLENMVDCEGQKLCMGAENLLSVLELPWLLVADFSDPEAGEATKEPTLKLTCKTSLGNMSDTCSGAIGGPATNEEDGNILFELSENELVSPTLNCTIGGAKSGLMVGTVVLSSPAGMMAVSP
jgi:hypothetical protein